MKAVIGIDEVGRGAWAGPLVVGAVQLSKPIHGLRDSKLLSHKKRIEFVKRIYKTCDKWGLGWVGADEIDRLGLSQAMTLAVERALYDFGTDCEIVIDGSVNYLPGNPRARCEVAADSTIPAVSAASILAKVVRDNHMIEQSKQFPAYSFEKHVGYGTKLHSDLIKKFGPCSIHRKSYKPIREMIKIGQA